MQYNPSVPPKIETVPELLRFVMEEFNQISRASQEVTVVELRPIYRAPDKPREGMIVYADGTEWNPGAGKGAYVYTGAAWSKL